MDELDGRSEMVRKHQNTTTEGQVAILKEHVEALESKTEDM
jgi:hypothetical protein